jgi:hypothetical protein
VKRVYLTSFALVAAALAAIVLWQPDQTARPLKAWSPSVNPPANSLRVLWVGHSLMNARDPHAKPSRNLPETVSVFAAVKKLGNEAVEHMLFGSPLSLLWRGSPHGFSRPEPQMRVQREAIIANAKTIDAVVMTEVLAVRVALKTEHSAYYAQMFACGIRRANPSARVYVYETWSHLNASNVETGYGPQSTFNWSRRMAEDRHYTEQLADLAATGTVPAPGLLARVSQLLRQPAPCENSGPILIVPVGSVFRELDSLFQHEHLEYQGRRITTGDLFANAYTTWPAGWPLAKPLEKRQETATLSKLPLRYPQEPLDDIHPSELGVYVSSLVHFATLYGRTPEGLPNLVSGLPDDVAHRLARIVWEKVRHDPRTGVKAD